MQTASHLPVQNNRKEESIQQTQQQRHIAV